MDSEAPLHNILADRYCGLGRFRRVAIRFEFEAETRLTFLREEQGYKGSAFHGRFETGLAQLAPAAWAALCNAAPTIKPYWLAPPLDNALEYQPGHIFHLDLALFGPAVCHAEACAEALRHTSGEAQLSTLRGRYRLIGSQALPFPRECPPPNNSPSTTRITLHCTTPLRLQGATRREPDFRSVFKKLLDRLRRLTALEPDAQPIDEAALHLLLSRAATIATVRNQLQWFDWPRYSPRQRTWMKLGGFRGQITFAGNLAPFIPYLRLGEWTHLGGKTGFGHGRYRLQIHEGA